MNKLQISKSILKGRKGGGRDGEREREGDEKTHPYRTSPIYKCRITETTTTIMW